MSHYTFSQDNDPNNLKPIELIDEDKRSLLCYEYKKLEIEDQDYLLVSPVDTPIRVLAWDGEDGEAETEDSELILIEDPEEIDEIFENAKAVLGELNLILKNTAYTLTVEGEIPPFDEDDMISLEMDDEDGDGSEPIEEDLQFLTSFHHGQYKYSIYTPIEPILYIVKRDSSGKVEIVDHEDQKIKPIIEAFLFEDQDEDEK